MAIGSRISDQFRLINKLDLKFSVQYVHEASSSYKAILRHWVEFCNRVGKFLLLHKDFEIE